MAGMAHVTIVGNLTKDAELKYSQAGLAICLFSVAVNFKRKEQGGQYVDDVNYYSVALFGARGEAVSQYLTKGKQVAVEGALSMEAWTNAAGERNTQLKVKANDIVLLGSRDDGQRGGQRDDRGYDDRPRQAPPRQQAPQQRRAPRQADPQDDFPDDIPF